MRGWTFAAVGAVLVLGACRTTGYTTGELVQLDCARSPIQSTWNNVYTPSWGKCIRKAADGSTVNAYAFGRELQIPGGYSNVLYVQAKHRTYIEPGSLKSAMQSFHEVEANARDWSPPRRMPAGGRMYETMAFRLRDRSCAAFLSYDGPDQYSAGYANSALGYACANRLDPDDLEKLLSSLTFDPTLADGAPTTPMPPPEKAKPKAKPKPPSVPI